MNTPSISSTLALVKRCDYYNHHMHTNVSTSTSGNIDTLKDNDLHTCTNCHYCGSKQSRILDMTLNEEFFLDVRNMSKHLLAKSTDAI